MSEFRALCATCAQPNSDPLALTCPSCGSRRLVVVAGRRAVPEVSPVVPQRIRKGSTVTLDSAHGPIERKVVKIAGDVLVVSRAEEVRAAKKAGRKPRGIGFKRKDVLSRPPTPNRADIAGRKGGLATARSAPSGPAAVGLSKESPAAKRPCSDGSTAASTSPGTSK